MAAALRSRWGPDPRNKPPSSGRHCDAKRIILAPATMPHLQIADDPHRSLRCTHTPRKVIFVGLPSGVLNSARMALSASVHSFSLVKFTTVWLCACIAAALGDSVRSGVRVSNPCDPPTVYVLDIRASRRRSAATECNSVVCMIGSEACLRKPLKLLCLDLGGGVVSARVMILKGLVDRDDVGRLCRCGREGSECECCKDRDKSDRFAESSRYHDLTHDVVPSLGSSTERIIHAETMSVAPPNWGICLSVGAVCRRTWRGASTSVSYRRSLSPDPLGGKRRKRKATRERGRMAFAANCRPGYRFRSPSGIVTQPPS